MENPLGINKISFVVCGTRQPTFEFDSPIQGWRDATLSEKGVKEAHTGAQALKDQGIELSFVYLAYFSRLPVRRGIYLSSSKSHQDTLDHPRRNQPDVDPCCSYMEIKWKTLWCFARIEQSANGWKTWRRTGSHRWEFLSKFFNQYQVAIWRRSYDIPPPPLDLDDPTYPGKDRAYADLTPDQIPRTECLKDTVARVLVFWNEEIAPAILGLWLLEFSLNSSIHIFSRKEGFNCSTRKLSSCFNQIFGSHLRWWNYWT